MIDLINKHLAEFNAASWNEWKTTLSPDVMYEEMATRVKVKGADEWVKISQRWKKAFPDLTGKLLGAMESADGSEMAAEVEWAGTHTGPLEGPMGTIPPTNKRGTVRATMLFKVRNNKIAEAKHFFDLLTILAQLGVAPMPGMHAQPGTAGTAQAAPRRP